MAAAQAAHGRGRLDESERLFRQVAEAHEQDWEARQFLAILLARRGQDQEALQLLTWVLETNPQAFEALFWLSMLERKNGRRPESVEHAARAAAARPENAAAWNNLGVCEMEAGRLEQAISAFRSAAAQRPDPTTLFNLATCLGLVGQDLEALKVLREAARIAPGSPDVHLLLAKTLLNLNELEEAIQEGEAALQLNPQSAASHRLLALAHMHAGHAAKSRGHAEGALQLEPNDAGSYATLGSVLQSEGELEESSRAFQRSIEFEPRQGHAYAGLLQNRRLTAEDRRLLDRMETLVSESPLAPKDESMLEYGLGKGYEDLGEFQRAMGHYDSANRIARRLKFGDEQYDTAKATAETDLKIRRYSAEFLSRARGQGSPTDLPIFVVGMMRSGTTLVEQILSSHPDVAAAGEQDFWLKRGLECIGDGGDPDLECLRRLGGEYLALLSELGGSAPHVTDKMPANYLQLGLIHAAFPSARIVHVRRNPVDTAISIYATPNRARIDYAHDKRSIVAAYREYQRLMEHWRAVLPQDRFLEVRYEELIENRDEMTRSMAAYCGLPWDDAMLAPESNTRSVVTPSVSQVRRPVYRTSIGRGERFGPWLGPFRELL